jgi:hypothetical protein
MIPASPGTTSTSISTTVSTTISSTTKTESSTATTSVTISNASVQSKIGASSTGTFTTATNNNGTATQNILITATRSVTISQTEAPGTSILTDGSPSSSSSPTASGNPLGTASNATVSGSGHSNMGVIIGAVVGVVAALVLGALVLLCFIRKRRRHLATGSLKHMEAEGNALPGNSVQSLLPRDMTYQDLPPSPGAIPAAQPHDETPVYGYGTSSIPLRGASKLAAAARARLLANSNANMSARPLSDIAPPTYTERP